MGLVRWAIGAIVAVALLQGAPAWASSISTPISLTSFGDMVVDNTNQHVFISSPADNEIAIYDFSGDLVTTLTNVPGAYGMVINGSNLYVAESTAGTIEEIDLATLTDDGSVATGLVDPKWLAFAGGQLWTATEPNNGFYLLTSASLAGTVTVFPASESTEFAEPNLATSPATPNLLYVSQTGLEASNLYELDVSSGSPTIVASEPESNQENTTDLAVSPDGTRVITADSDTDGFFEFSPSTLSTDGVLYPSGNGPSAVAVSPGDGGLVATGIDDGTPGSAISVFKLGTTSALFSSSTYGSTGSSDGIPHGLALSADGTTLFAVGHVYGTNALLRLWTFGLGTPSTATTTTLDANQIPSSSGYAVSLTATVAPTDGGGSVSFYANDALISGCDAVPVTDTSSVETATCTTSLPRGQVQFLSYYSGDSAYAGSDDSSSINIAGGDYTWSGADPSYDGQSFDYWEVGSNWVGDAAPSGSVGTLTFPSLTSSACTTTPPSDACYATFNDLTGVTASGVVIDSDGAYDIGGEGFWLGAGGLTVESPDGNDSPQTIQPPITLQAPQTWTIDEGPTLLDGNVAGAQALTVDFDHGSIEPAGGLGVGDIEATGDGGFYLDGSMTLNWPGTALTTVESGAGIEADQQYNHIGGLNVDSGGWVSVGGVDNGGGTLSVSGDLTFNNGSELDLAIDAPGTTAGLDYSQVTATGDVDLNGAQLDLSQGADIAGSCDELNPGDTLTLLSTSATITGTFANYANGASVDIANDCDNGIEDAVGTLSYSASAVTLTITEPGDAGDPGSPPELSPPSLSGTAIVGQTLQVDPGTWQGATSFDYSWWACDDSGNCTEIPNASGSTFQITSAQLGDQIGAIVTAVGPDGTNYDYTNLSDVVTAAPAPTVSIPTTTQSSSISAAAVTAALQGVLKPVGKSASLAAVLSHHGYTFIFHAPGAGKLVVTWSGSVKHKTVTVAKGRATASGAEGIRVFVRLTAAGTADLKKYSRLRIKSVISFSASGLAPIVKSSSFTLSGRRLKHASSRSSAPGHSSHSRPPAGSLTLRLMKTLFGSNRVARGRTQVTRSAFTRVR